MPKAAKKASSASATAAAAVHPYAKGAPQFKFGSAGSAGSPKKAAGKVGQSAATPGTTTKSANASAMRAPSLQASNPRHKHKRHNNFVRWAPEKVAEYLEYTVEEKDGKSVPKVGKLVKSKAWVDRNGQTVQPKQAWKLNQYGKDGLYFDSLLKIFQVYNNTDTPGNRKKLTFRAYFVTEDGELDHEAAKNFKSFVGSFQEWAYKNRDNLPWQWSKGAKNIAKKLKEIAAETNNATFEDIMTDPKWQKYKTKTNEDTGDDYYLNWDKEEIGIVNPDEPPPAGAVVTGNKFFPRREKTDRKADTYAEFDMNFDKYADVVDATTPERKSISLTDITEGSIVRTRGIQTLYALNEQQIVGGVPKLPMGRDPVLEVLFMNPDGRKIQPDKSAGGGTSSSGDTSSGYAAYHEQQTNSLAARMAARMAGN